jgi:quercetin dioxygenase-like cupin family protein
MSHTIPPPPNPRRLITTHDASGKAVWSDAYEEMMVPDEVKDKLRLFNAFTTTGMPANLNNDADLEAYRQHYPKMTTLHSTGGTVVRIVDWAPLYRSSDHRSVTLDFGVLLDGELEAILDDGSMKLMKPGDIIVQRGTMHGWRNPSPTKWARGLWVLQDIQPVVINGKELGNVTDLSHVYGKDIPADKLEAFNKLKK